LEVEIHVVAGTIADADGRVLIAQRPRGRHMAGRWEFPGGKLAAGEDPLTGLKRELAVELGIAVRAARPLIRLRHTYPERRVLLDVWQVTDYEGEPQALESQALAWARPDDLPQHDLLEADRAIVTALRLPRLARVLAPGETLQSIRGRAAQTILVPAPEDEAGELDAEAVAAARAAGHRIFVMGVDVDAVRVAALARCDGVLLRWHGQSLHVDRSGEFLVGAHCVDAEGAKQAVAEGAHFLVIAPEDGSLSERLLERLCVMVGRPVFAGWYPDARRLERLQALGAHGCAVRR
jgi:8-oxo-dGTP diphosphatase